MCGRFELNATPAQIQDHFGELLANGDSFAPYASYNIAPSLSPLIVRERKGENRIEPAVWGFRPHWAKRAQINARSETLFTAGMFKDSASRRRCLVLATGWYEWKPLGGKAKQPYYFHLDGLFAFAGIWTVRKTDDGWEVSFAIVTAQATGVAQEIHARMPIVMHEQHYAAWLDPGTESPSALLTARGGNELAAYPVSTFVNKPENDSPACIEPVAAA